MVKRAARRHPKTAGAAPSAVARVYGAADRRLILRVPHSESDCTATAPATLTASATTPPHTGATPRLCQPRAHAEPSATRRLRNTAAPTAALRATPVLSHHGLPAVRLHLQRDQPPPRPQPRRTVFSRPVRRRRFVHLSPAAAGPGFIVGRVVDAVAMHSRVRLVCYMNGTAIRLCQQGKRRV